MEEPVHRLDRPIKVVKDRKVRAKDDLSEQNKVGDVAESLMA